MSINQKNYTLLFINSQTNFVIKILNFNNKKQIYRYIKKTGDYFFGSEKSNLAIVIQHDKNIKKGSILEESKVFGSYAQIDVDESIYLGDRKMFYNKI